ncbi:hypothetical protein ACFRAQ_23415 [Nocardia sp. NPDC056611]|uniref:hypothetical protein n=1 Tax=Nocardia sp. NPDC056611 TaxID=3345877 RepID=UPI003671093D
MEETFSTELLADLHGGNLPPEQSARLWPEVRRDPEAMRYLNALDGVDDRLRELGRDENITHPIPTDVADRLERMIDDLAAEDTPIATAPMPVLNGSIFTTGRLDPRDLEEPLLPADLDEDETMPAEFTERPSRRLRWLTAAAAAAALAAGAVVAVDALSTRPTTPAAQPTAGDELDPALSPGVVLTAMGRHDITGPLAAGTALTDCLRAADLDRQVLGSRSVVFSGTPGVLVLLQGPKAPQITAAVLGTNCAPGHPQVLGRTDIG